MKKKSASFVIPVELKALLEKWAQEDDRSLSAVVRRLITDEQKRREAQQQQPYSPKRIIGNV